VAGPGTARGLRQVAGSGGKLSVVAVDQRQALRKMLDAAGHDASVAAMCEFKRDVALAVDGHCSALLLDPQWGLPTVISHPGVAAHTPLIVALEESGTLSWQGGRRSVLLTGWSPQQARNSGACAAKLLVYLRPDHAPSAREALAVMTAAKQACRAADLPFILEVVPYRLDEEDEQGFAAAYGAHVNAAAQCASELAPDLLKLPWPGRLDAASPLDVECGALESFSNLGCSWALLSAGADVNVFAARVEFALDEGGACGFICGRALWADAVGSADRHGALATAVERLDRLVALLDGRGRPLAIPSISMDESWYLA
jgi:tagatose 1,6-diphosphate aldolase